MLKAFIAVHLFLSLFLVFDVVALAVGAPADAFLMFSGIWGVCFHGSVLVVLLFFSFCWFCDDEVSFDRLILPRKTVA